MAPRLYSALLALLAFAFVVNRAGALLGPVIPVLLPLVFVAAVLVALMRR